MSQISVQVELENVPFHFTCCAKIQWRMDGTHVRFDSLLGRWLLILKRTFTKISEDLKSHEERTDSNHRPYATAFETVILLIFRYFVYY